MRVVKTVRVIFENGVLRPLEPLQLDENQEVTITISGALDDGGEKWLDRDCLASLQDGDEPEQTARYKAPNPNGERSADSNLRERAF